MNWPLVSIVITTYKRTEVALETIRALQDNLVYSGDIQWIISDDGSEDAHRMAIKEVLPSNAEILNVSRAGVGKSKNEALTRAFSGSPYVLLSEDDWKLNTKFDLHPHVSVLKNNEKVGIIRLGYLGGGMVAHLEDLDGPCTPYWILHQGTGVYVYSGQISLRHQRFYNVVGMHREGISPGEEELDMCVRYNATNNAPLIVWPATLPCAQNTGPFRHIGNESLNAQEVGT